jgi:S-DNA-T family DNA segregation ATPase FtsK/SpoIIIE
MSLIGVWWLTVFSAIALLASVWYLIRGKFFTRDNTDKQECQHDSMVCTCLSGVCTVLSLLLLVFKYDLVTVPQLLWNAAAYAVATILFFITYYFVKKKVIAEPLVSEDENSKEGIVPAEVIEESPHISVMEYDVEVNVGQVPEFTAEAEEVAESETETEPEQTEVEEEAKPNNSYLDYLKAFGNMASVPEKKEENTDIENLEDEVLEVEGTDEAKLVVTEEESVEQADVEDEAETTEDEAEAVIEPEATEEVEEAIESVEEVAEEAIEPVEEVEAEPIETGTEHNTESEPEEVVAPAEEESVLDDIFGKIVEPYNPEVKEAAITESESTIVLNQDSNTDEMQEELAEVEELADTEPLEEDSDIEVEESDLDFDEVANKEDEDSNLDVEEEETEQVEPIEELTEEEIEEPEAEALGLADDSE